MRTAHSISATALTHCTAAEDADVRILLHRNIAAHLWAGVKTAPTAMHMWDMLAASCVSSVQVTASTLVQKIIGFKQGPAESTQAAILRINDVLALYGGHMLLEVGKHAVAEVFHTMFTSVLPIIQHNMSEETTRRLLPQLMPKSNRAQRSLPCQGQYIESHAQGNLRDSSRNLRKHRQMAVKRSVE
jgi:hypothetical protein